MSEKKSFKDVLAEYTELTKQYQQAQSDVMKQAREILVDPNASDEDKMLASMFKMMSNSIFGNTSYPQQYFSESNISFNNMKVVVSPAGTGKTRYLVEEAIAMSDYGRVLYITYEDLSDHIKKLIYNNNVNNIGNYENICISSCSQVRNIENKLTWIINSISDAVKQYDFKYLIIDDLSGFVQPNEVADALKKIYTKFFELRDILISIQSPHSNDATSRANILHTLYNVPTVIEVKKERITKENGDVYGQYETIKNFNYVCTEMTNDMYDLYHYDGEFLIHRARG